MNRDASDATEGRVSATITTIDGLPTGGTAWVIDNALQESFLAMIETIRSSLPLDNKRPTVDRRFFADGKSHTAHQTTTNMKNCRDGTGNVTVDVNRPLASTLECTIQHHVLDQPSRTNVHDKRTGDVNDTTNKLQSISINTDRTVDHLDVNPSEKDPLVRKSASTRGCHVLRYMRFLEYSRSGTGLDTHTDGTKVCEDTGRTSTHTMLLYLSDVAEGGETVLLQSCQKVRRSEDNSTEKESQIIYKTQPKRGRILLFPHRTPHEGSMVIDTPKICLRAETCIW